MTYKIKNIKPISKFDILSIRKEHTNYGNNFNLSKIFWNQILDKSFFQKFIKEKYIKKNYLKFRNKDEYNIFLENYNFVCSKLDINKSNISFIDKSTPPSGEDIILSYNLFSTILNYYNDYYKDEFISIGLKTGLDFKEDYSGVDSFFNNLNKYQETKLICELFYPILDEILSVSDDNTLYRISIFWPGEIFIAGIISNYLKKNNKNSKVVLDLSQSNEQFDFTQWTSVIKENTGYFFNIFDFFLIDRDFGRGLNSLMEVLNSKGNLEDLVNVLSFDKVKKKIYYKKINYTKLEKSAFQSFVDSTFSKNQIGYLLGKKYIYGRFLPYKCYWDNCNFCAINSQNKFIYNNDFSYNYFISKWVSFIEGNNIYYVHFGDEAIPPLVIIKFAKEIIKKGLKIEYQFRTRFEKAYTKQNCIILAKSGARFCGMGLESASDRVNEEIGNKGNGSISLKEKLKIIHYMDNSGISIHNYSIMGFPGETDKEFSGTYIFLKQNIISTKYFTCSPNIFGLMKGPKIFTEREQYGIEIEKKYLDNPFNLIFPFKCNGKPRNMDLLNKYVEDLHRAQFLPGLFSVNHGFRFTSFWEYVDRSYAFYLMKVSHKINPYRYYFDINTNILEKDYSIIIKQHFKLTLYYTFVDNHKSIRNWVNFYCLNNLTLEEKQFVIDYNQEKSLEENLLNQSSDIKKDFVLNLIKYNFLLLS